MFWPSNIILCWRKITLKYVQFKIPPSIGQNHSLVVILLLCRDGFCVAIKVIQPTLNVGLREAVVVVEGTENPSILSRQNFNC